MKKFRMTSFALSPFVRTAMCIYERIKFTVDETLRMFFEGNHDNVHVKKGILIILISFLFEPISSDEKKRKEKSKWNRNENFYVK